MRDVKTKIDKTEYERLNALTVGELHAEVEKNIPDAWRWGYGWYGCHLYEKDGEYFIVDTIGDTCD